MKKKKGYINDPLKNIEPYGEAAKKIIISYIFSGKIREMKGGIKLNQKK